MLPKPQRIYLDNAATSWPKPPSVLDAISRFYLEHGSAAGRGVAGDAVETDRTVQSVRAKLAEFVGAEHPSQLVFTFNGTDSLNMAIRGMLRPGDHVITTVLEHNSVLRPLNYLQETGLIDLTTIGLGDDGLVDVERLDDSIVNNTKLICVSHASNVTGAVQPVAEIGRLEKPPQCFYLIDAAQTVGHLPVNVAELRCDLLAASGHKGLLGPLGTGILYINGRAAEEIEPWRLGGTGTASESVIQPTQLPQRLESGNHNVGGILGLGAGLDYIESLLIGNVESQIAQRTQRFLTGLESIAGVRVFGGPGAGGSGVVSFDVESIEPSDLATILDAQFGVQIRAGLHCSPLAHAAIGSDATGGTARVSFGVFNTNDDVDTAVQAITEIANG